MCKEKVPPIELLLCTPFSNATEEIYVKKCFKETELLSKRLEHNTFLELHKVPFSRMCS
jgi:hypothetical protein